MQAFFVEKLELDRCGACARVWLDLNEVDRFYGLDELALTEVELEWPCPRGHGALVRGQVGPRVVDVCPRCHGVLLQEFAQPEAAPAAAPSAPSGPSPQPESGPQPSAPKKPRVKAASVTVACDRCGKVVPVSETGSSNRGLCCRACELEEIPPTPSEQTAWKVVRGLGRVLAFFLDLDV